MLSSRQYIELQLAADNFVLRVVFSVIKMINKDYILSKVYIKVRPS